MAYINFPDMIARYDRNDVLALLSDTQFDPQGYDVGTDPPPPFTECADDASGTVDAYIMRGGRYTIADLAGLTGTALAFLKRITCDICMCYLMERRPDRNPQRVAQQRELAEAHLKMLASGEMIFAIPNAINAGLESIVGPSCVEVQQLNLPVDHCRPHYYPRLRLPESITRTNS
jgi:phage gp36-like protein